MQLTKYVKVNGRGIPVLISDDNEVLLAAKAAGRAVVGLQGMLEVGAAAYAVEALEDLDDEFLERVARRHLGLPWRICETRRLIIRELFQGDFDELWENRVGHGFETPEKLEAYTKRQYAFYEFGFWALAEKEGGELVGVAGLTLPRKEETDGRITLTRTFPDGEGELELGYHIFPAYRRQGYAKESSQAILRYGTEQIGACRFLVRVRPENKASLALARWLGFR
ncbi:MAG: GNAT family N-acetyltransferase [Lachnospiraceae bacterium]|nr:GNAT family N-acetyltransferase [Lachnospiraceae bacterium]